LKESSDGETLIAVGYRSVEQTSWEHAGETGCGSKVLMNVMGGNVC